MRMMGICLALALAGCATAAPTWQTVDGKAPDTRQLQVTETVCQGEVAKGIAGSQPEIRERAAQDIFAGCMASHGYMQAAAH